jgi:hypothetical protein
MNLETPDGTLTKDLVSSRGQIAKINALPNGKQQATYRRQQ